MSIQAVAHVNEYTESLRALLLSSRSLKPIGQIDPVIKPQDLEDGIRQVSDLADVSGYQSFAAIETACRDIFYKTLVSAM